MKTRGPLSPLSGTSVKTHGPLSPPSGTCVTTRGSRSPLSGTSVKTHSGRSVKTRGSLLPQEASPGGRRRPPQGPTTERVKLLHARMHLERSWDAPLSAPGALHPRAGTHECTWNDPGTHHRVDLGQTILEQARTECSWNSPGTHYAHQPRAGTHGMHLEQSWGAPFSGPGKHHPRVGTSACLALDLATGPGDPPGSDSAGAIF